VNFDIYEEMARTKVDCNVKLNNFCLKNFFLKCNCKDNIFRYFTSHGAAEARHSTGTANCPDRSKRSEC